MPTDKADITAAGPRLRAMNDALEASDRLQAEIARLRSQSCPYVTGNVTKYCTLTPMTLTDGERGLLTMLADHPVTHQIMPHEVATLRGLLDRTNTGEK